MTQSSSCLPRVPLGWFVSDKGEWALRSLANLQASKIERVGDTSGSNGGRVDVADCSPFLTGGLDLGVLAEGCIHPHSFGTLDHLG